MITDAQGRPVASNGNVARKIELVEVNQNGKMVWAVDYHPSIGAFEFEKVFQILGSVVKGIATQARSVKQQFIQEQQMQTAINKAGKE